MMKTSPANKLLAMLLLFFLAVMSACNSDKSMNKGRLNVSITDAPLEVGDVTGVFISIKGVELKGADGWETLEQFEAPVQLNLLDYQNGKSLFLTEDELPVGVYSEIRLKLDIPEQNKAAQANPGCYVTFADGRVEPLFVPSGAQSGYKVKGSFDIIADGLTNVTLDLDVRKALVKAGQSGKYLLKPVVRLVVNELAGKISGEVSTEQGKYEHLVVFAYKHNTYTEAEAADPAEGETRFPGAITSSVVDPVTHKFTLAFMEPGRYDLVFAAYDAEGNFIEVASSLPDLEVKSRESLNIFASF